MKDAEYYFYEVMGFKPYERSEAMRQEFREGVSREERVANLDKLLKKHNLTHLKKDYVLYNKLQALYMPIFNVTPNDQAVALWAGIKKAGCFRWKGEEK